MAAAAFVVASSAGLRTVATKRVQKVGWIIGIVNGRTVDVGEKP